MRFFLRLDVEKHGMQLSENVFERVAIFHKARRVCSAHSDNVAIKMLLHDVMQRLPPAPQHLPVQPANSAVFHTPPAASRPYLSKLPRQCACAECHKNTMREGSDVPCSLRLRRTSMSLFISRV